MRVRWLIPFAVLLPLRLIAVDDAVKPRVETLTINPSEVTALHLRPEFESAIHMPEEITSVILGSPGSFKAEHNEGEPDYVYVKPITKEAAQSNLLIATRSGQHVSIELLSDGVGGDGSTLPVDFLIEYRTSRSFLIPAGPGAEHGKVELTETTPSPASPRIPASATPLSAVDEEYEQQIRINAPGWTKWESERSSTSEPGGNERNASTAASSSISEMVVHGRAPDISQLLHPRINTAAHPPGPGFRIAEPSVKM